MPGVNAHRAIPSEAYAVSTNTTLRAPTSLAQARTAPDSIAWRAAYDEELQRHQKFGTFKLVPTASLPAHVKPRNAVTTYTYKYNDRGDVIGRKVRFSYPGNRMLPGIHYDPTKTATYAANRAAVRLLLALASKHRVPRRQLDITSAFLHENYDWPTNLYLKPIRSFDGTRSQHQTALLQRNLYGTPQAPATYMRGLHKYLKEHGYTRPRSDRSVYYKRSAVGSIVMAVTIDDFLVIATNDGLYDTLVSNLKKKYVLKDLGIAKQLLGWSITREETTGSIHVSQPTLTKMFIETLGIQQANPTANPYRSGAQLHECRDGEKPLADNYPYTKALEMERYLADSTRPDISHVVGVLARYMQRQTHRHWLSLKHLARYLKGTSTHGLYYGGRTQPNQPSHMSLQTFADAAHADCPDTLRSTYGMLTYLNDRLIAWRSCRMRNVATSSTAAEYVALNDAAKHTKWLRSLLQEITQTEQPPIKLCSDSTAAAAIANAQGPTRTSKFIDIRHKELNEYVEDGIVTMEHIPSRQMPADALTKALSRMVFQQNANTMHAPPCPTNIPWLSEYHNSTIHVCRTGFIT